MTDQEKEQKIKEFHFIKHLLHMTYKSDVPTWVDTIDMHLSYTDITSLPEDLYIPGYLFLQFCKSLTSLPKGLHVGGSLDLHGCENLKSLPKDLYVGGNLYLGGCTSLPENLVLPNVKGVIHK